MREFTIEQLAAAAGTITTTVRMYQARGLLPPPTRRGRVAVYNDGHLQRLTAIAELQDRGHSLAGIGELLAAAAQGRGLVDVIGVRWGQAPTITISAIELLQRFGPVPPTADEMILASRLGLIRAPEESNRDDPNRDTSSPDNSNSNGSNDGVVVVDGRFLALGTELAAMGVPIGALLDEWVHLTAQAATIASRFTAVFERHILPTLDQPPTLTAVAEALNRLGPLAQQATSLAVESQLVDRAHVELARHAQ